MNKRRQMMPIRQFQISDFRFQIPLRALVLLAALGGPGCATMKLNLQAGGLLVAYADIKKGRFDDAMDEVLKLEKRTDLPPEVRSEAAYVKARVLEGQKKLPEAIAQYRFTLENYPQTPDGYLSRKRLKELNAPPVP
jgi:tetratricopeptide (TPR) repeat protein